MKNYHFPSATNMSAHLLTPWERAAGREHPKQRHQQSSRHVSRPSDLLKSAPCHHLSSRISPGALNGVANHTPIALFLQESPQNIMHTFLYVTSGHHPTSPSSRVKD